MVFVWVWDRFEQVYEQTAAEFPSFHTGLGRVKTGFDRRRVDFHTGLGTGSDRFGQVWLCFSYRFGTGLSRFKNRLLQTPSVFTQVWAG